MLFRSGDNYFDQKKATLPTHYSTPAKSYCFSTTIKTLGRDEKMTPFIKNKKTFDGKLVYDGNTKYNCKYDVLCVEPLIISNCDTYFRYCGSAGASIVTSCEDGMKLEFSPISLYEKPAFPGLTDGSVPAYNDEGRKRGNNWASYADVENVIYKGRDVQSYDIYKLSPMYEIELDVKTMREIRDYNRLMNRTPMTLTTPNLVLTNPTQLKSVKVRTGVLGYLSYENFECTAAENGKGDKCISKKIREWGVKGCAVSEGFTSAKFPKCSTTEKW